MLNNSYTIPSNCRDNVQESFWSKQQILSVQFLECLYPQAFSKAHNVDLVQSDHDLCWQQRDLRVKTLFTMD